MTNYAFALLAIICALPFAVLAEEKEQGFDGSVELGINFSTGNTESEDVSARTDLSYRAGDWKHELGAQLINSKENDIQTDEEYRLEIGTNYDYSDRSFLFGEASYVKNRFSGFDYRISEVLGVGHTWVEIPYLTWSSQVGGGFQHTETTTGVKEDSPLARFENSLDIKVTETTDFSNKIRIDASEISTFETETSLKNAISDSLFLKITVQTETLSDAPAGNEKTDTDTTVNIAYEF